ncbi:hypothetical protein JCM10207_003549 [Rhodosporidiobolus poonsookiae]
MKPPQQFHTQGWQIGLTIAALVLPFLQPVGTWLYVRWAWQFWLDLLLLLLIALWCIWDRTLHPEYQVTGAFKCCSRGRQQQRYALGKDGSRRSAGRSRRSSVAGEDEERLVGAEEKLNEEGRLEKAVREKRQAAAARTRADILARYS